MIPQSRADRLAEIADIILRPLWWVGIVGAGVFLILALPDAIARAGLAPHCTVTACEMPLSRTGTAP